MNQAVTGKPHTPYKLDTVHKKAIISLAIEGKSIKETVEILLTEYKLDVSGQTVWVTRTKNAKRIARALENELDQATALSPLATLPNRLAVLERVIEEGFADLDDAKKLLADPDLNPEQESFIHMKGIRSLQAVNDAVKIADAAVNRMRSLQQKLKEYNAKNNLGTRDLVEETIIAVQRRVYETSEKQLVKRANMAELADDVDWIEDGDLED